MPDHVAYLRYRHRKDKPEQPYIVICDCDIPGAFPVYKQPLVDKDYAQNIVEAARGYYKAIATKGHALDPVVCEARRHLLACLVSKEGVDALLIPKPTKE